MPEQSSPSLPPRAEVSLLNTWRRRFLALLSVPLLAVPSAVGVYAFLATESGWLAAGLAAAGFEVLYIGVNVLVITTPDLRRYARNVSLAAVIVAVLMNSLAHYATNVPRAYTGALFQPLTAVLALIASAPLAGLAYAVSVLLHRLSEADVRNGAEDVRLRAALAQRDSEIARLRDDFAEQAAALAHAQDEHLRHATEIAHAHTTAAAEVAQRDSEIAHLRAAVISAAAPTTLDVTAIARLLREPRAIPWREIEDLLGVAQSTLRSRLDLQARQNGPLATIPD